MRFQDAFTREAIQAPEEHQVELLPRCIWTEGGQSGTANCEAYRIIGNQINYGVETMPSCRILESLMVTGGLSVLNPKLTDTGIAATKQ